MPREMAKAEALKAEGNAFFVANNFHGAERCYIEAMKIIRGYDEFESQAETNKITAMSLALFSNTAACYLKTGEYEKALKLCDYCLNEIEDTKGVPIVRDEAVVAKIRARRTLALERLCQKGDLTPISDSFSSPALVARMKECKKHENKGNLLFEGNDYRASSKHYMDAIQNPYKRRFAI
jgi:tetratricopeptide (TPR) repeat protein